MVKKIVEEAKPVITEKQKSKNYRSSSQNNSSKEVEKLLIENFAGLQRAMTNLSIKFGALSDNISNLLKIFEESAKSYAQRGGEKEENKEIIKKIDSLIDQNKTIAKGLVLMEDHLKKRINSSGQHSSVPVQPVSYRPKPLPRP